MTTPDLPREHDRTNRAALLWTAITAAVAGFADLIVSMIRLPLPDEYEAANTIFGPLAATTLAALAVFAALGVTLRILPRCGIRIPVLTLYIAVTIALIAFEVLLLLLGVLLPTELAPDLGTRLLKLGVVSLISLLLVRGTLPLATYLGATLHTRRSPASCALAAPWLCALTLLLLWVTRLRLDAPLASKQGLLIIALTGLAGLAVLLFFYCVGHLRVGRAAAVFPLCAVLAAPALGFLPRAGESGSRTDSVSDSETKHTTTFLITIDSLRADALSCYGSTVVQTPNIDGVAQDGVLFSTAISASSWTLPAVASFMTGVSPVVHGATAWQKRLPDDFKTLAESFKEAGYRTVAVGQNPVLDSARNIDQGFDEYHWISTETRHPGISLGRSLLSIFLEHALESTTEQITRTAIARLGEGAGPAFYWIHYYDPHMPYAPPEDFMADTQANATFGASFDDFERVRMGRFGGKQAERDWIKSLYDAEVRFVDSELGRLIAAIKDRGLYENATIIISSDHGEEFWDHGGFEHGHTMYQELLRVPLIVKHPGIAAGQVDAPVGTEALTPTLLELTGLPCDATTMTSASFAPLLRPEKASPPAGSVSSFGTLYFEKLEAVTGPQYKYIRSVDFDTEELYDRTSDPLEEAPLPPKENPAAVQDARQILESARTTGNATAPVDTDDVVLDPGTEDSLRSLGYIN